MKRILITGATGQIGSELTRTLRAKYGGDNVLAAGHRRDPTKDTIDAGPTVRLDVRNREALLAIVATNKIDSLCSANRNGRSPTS